VEIEARQPTGKGPAERFTGDVWGEHVTDIEYQAAHQAVRGENSRSHNSDRQPT
jgi:hypothetical protein